MTLYATVDQAVNIYGLAQQTERPRTLDPRAVFRNLQIASRRVDQQFQSNRPVFAPYHETRKVALDSTAVNSRMGTFQFPGWLLALTGSVTINGTAVTVEAYPDSAMPPFKRLRLTDDCRDWYAQACACCAPLQVSIPGIWGFHPHYAEAWMQVDALADAINASETTLTVADADGEDAYGMTPRFSPGHLLRIDSEYLEVIRVEPSLNTLVVRRGVNGTTAAAHEDAAPIATWQVDSPVQRAVARQSGLMVARAGAYTTVEVREMSEVRYPADWLQEVLNTLQAYAYE